MAETPEREPVLAYLRRLPPGARGASATHLHDHLRQSGGTEVTVAGLRRQLAQLETEGLVAGRVVQSGGPKCWVATGGHTEGTRDEAGDDAPGRLPSDLGTNSDDAETAWTLPFRRRAAE